MKSELRENMYVRFKDKRGIKYIRKIVKIPEDNRYASIYLDKEANYSKGLSLKNIIKASYNIIDLIEVGDIIVDDTNRKLEVLLIDNELMVRNAGLIYDNNYYLPIKSIAIKSVITHEQMEQMAYKVGE